MTEDEIDTLLEDEAGQEPEPVTEDELEPFDGGSLFKDYRSKPITRRAMQLTESMILTNIRDGTFECVYTTPGREQRSVSFTAAEMPEVGGYVVHLSEDDIYYCSEAVFKSRNKV